MHQLNAILDCFKYNKSNPKNKFTKIRCYLRSVLFFSFPVKKNGTSDKLSTSLVQWRDSWNSNVISSKQSTQEIREAAKQSINGLFSKKKNLWEFIIYIPWSIRRNIYAYNFYHSRRDIIFPSYLSQSFLKTNHYKIIYYN